MSYRNHDRRKEWPVLSDVLCEDRRPQMRDGFLPSHLLPFTGNKKPPVPHPAHKNMLGKEREANKKWTSRGPILVAMTITYQATFGRLRVRDIVCLILRFGLRVRFCGPALRIVTPLGALYNLYLLLYRLLRFCQDRSRTDRYNGDRLRMPSPNPLSFSCPPNHPHLCA